MKKFTVCGITTINNISKVRWTDNLSRREKFFIKNGATRCELVELPHSMTKLEALDYISKLHAFSSVSDQTLISEAREYREVMKSKIDGSYEKKKRGRPKIVRIRPKVDSTVLEILKAADIKI